ncbi:MAG: murein biosynthesis integral membrane protein MurJ [Pseudomonadota bacterium]
MALLKSLATVSGLTMSSRVLGFARQVLATGVIGAGGSPVADAFWAAFRLPNLFRRLLAEGAFQAAFIPLFQAARVEGGDGSAKRYAEEILSALVVALSVLIALVQVFTPAFVTLLAGGFADEPEKFDLAVLYTRIMFPYLAFMSGVGLLSGVLNSLGRFAVAAGAPLLLNILMIGAVLFVAGDGPEAAGSALSWAVAAAGVAQLAALYWGAARAGYAVRPRLPRLTPGVKRLLVLGAPGFLAAGSAQINLIVGTNIASRESGAVSWLMNADQLHQLPVSLIGIGLGIVLLPTLSARVKTGDEAGARRALNRAVELSLLLALPATVALVLMGPLLCDALFRDFAGDALALVGAGGSAFTEDDALRTGAALAWFAVGLPAFIAQKVFSPAFFAREDTTTPMVFALVGIAANIFISVGGFPFVGFYSVAIGTSVAAILQALLLWRTAARRRHFEADARLKARWARIVAATLLMGGALWGALQVEPQMTAVLFEQSWLTAIALSVGGLAVYAVASILTGAVSVDDLRAALRRGAPA